MDFDKLIAAEENRLKTAAAEFQAFAQAAIKKQEAAQENIQVIQGGILMLRRLKEEQAALAVLPNEEGEISPS